MYIIHVPIGLDTVLVVTCYCTCISFSWCKLHILTFSSREGQGFGDFAQGRGQTEGREEEGVASQAETDRDQ